MRIKTGLSLLSLLFLALALVLSGCAEQGVDVGSNTGSMALNVKTDMSKTVVPDVDMNIASYDIVGTGPSGANFAVSNHSTSALAINDLAIGAWSVVVYAKNAAGTVIAMGSAAATVSAGLTSSVSITVTPLAGNGTLTIGISWVDALTNPTLEGTLTPVGGSASTLTGIVVGANSASYTDSSLAAGYYTLSLVLKADGTPIWGAVVAVRILAGETTSATHTLGGGSFSGSIDLSINQDLNNPISIVLSGNQANLASGTDMTIVATPAQAVDSYAWYLNGVVIAGETTSSLTIGSALADGNYRVDVVITSGTILSSTNATFTVGGAMPAAIKKVFSERAEGEDLSVDSSWQIWSSTVADFNLLTASGADSGTEVIQVVPSTNSWFGFVLLSDTTPSDLSTYNYLIVNLRTTDMNSTGIEVGVGTPSTDENWFSVDMNGKTDGAWHKFVIDVSAVNLSSVEWLFAMRNNVWSSGTVEFDDIHFSTVDPGDGETVTPPSVTTKKVYSELAVGEDIAMNSSWQIWEVPALAFSPLSEVGTDAGSEVIRVTPAGAGWFGFVLRTLSTTEDLSGFNYLKFSLRSTDINPPNLRVGVGTPTTDENWFSADMTGKLDGNWHDFTIDVSSANLASIEWGFAMLSDVAGYVSGSFDFDNVRFTTTP